MKLPGSSRLAGFDPLALPLREGTTYVIRATDFRGILMRVVVDARSGADPRRQSNRLGSGHVRRDRDDAAALWGGAAICLLAVLQRTAGIRSARIRSARHGPSDDAAVAGGAGAGRCSSRRTFSGLRTAVAASAPCRAGCAQSLRGRKAAVKTSAPPPVTAAPALEKAFAHRASRLSFPRQRDCARQALRLAGLLRSAHNDSLRCENIRREPLKPRTITSRAALGEETTWLPMQRSRWRRVSIACRPCAIRASLVTLLSLGGWFEFYDLFFTAYVAIGLFKEGLFSPTTHGLFDLHGFASFVAALFAGMFIGTLVFSWLSDRFGRRSIFTFALLWYSVGAFIMALQKTPETIDLWRLIASIGLGVELVNVDAYLSELVPKDPARAGFRLQPVHHVHRRAGGRVPRLAIGAADHPRPRRLAVGRHHRLDRRCGDLVDPPQSAGIAALAGAARARGRSRTYRRGHGKPRPRGNRRRVAAAGNRGRRSRAQDRRLGWRCGARPIAAAPSCW